MQRGLVVLIHFWCVYVVAQQARAPVHFCPSRRAGQTPSSLGLADYSLSRTHIKDIVHPQDTQYIVHSHCHTHIQAYATRIPTLVAER